MVILLVVSLFCFTLACQQGEEEPEEVGVKVLSDEDVAAIKAIDPALDNANLAGDFNAVVEMMTEDVLLMNPNGQIIQGGNMKKLSMIFPLALILCFMVGCQDKEAMAELEATISQAEVEEQNKALVLHWYEELDKGNIETLIDMFAPNFLWYSPSNSPTPMSREDAYEFLKTIFLAFPKWMHKMEEIIAAGDKVVTRAVDYSTHEGEFQGIPATGNKVEFGAIVIYRIENGKIVEMREEGDILGLMLQLGMELKPKGGENRSLK